MHACLPEWEPCGGWGSVHPMLLPPLGHLLPEAPHYCGLALRRALRVLITQHRHGRLFLIRKIGVVQVPDALNSQQTNKSCNGAGPVTSLGYGKCHPRGIAKQQVQTHSCVASTRDAATCFHYSYMSVHQQALSCTCTSVFVKHMAYKLILSNQGVDCEAGLTDPRTSPQLSLACNAMFSCGEAWPGRKGAMPHTALEV